MGSPRLRLLTAEAVIDFGATRTGQLFLRRANDLADTGGIDLPGGRSKNWAKVKDRKHPAMDRVMEALR